MSDRPFNKQAYKELDHPAKIKLVELIENLSGYKLDCDLEVEMFKKGDVRFRKGEKTVLFENEVRDNFDKIVQDYGTVHIPIRKQNTPADFYVVWRNDFSQFILIWKKTLDKYKNNIARDVLCSHEKNQDGPYVEDFIDIPKNETQWYAIGQNFKLHKLSYDR